MIPAFEHQPHDAAQILNRWMRVQGIGEIKAGGNAEPRESGFERGSVGVARSQDDSDVAKAAAALGLLQNAPCDFFGLALER